MKNILNDIDCINENNNNNNNYIICEYNVKNKENLQY